MKSDKINRLEIKKSESKDHLTKDQITFNKLTEKIHLLQQKNAKQKDSLEKLLNTYSEIVFPLENESLDHKLNLVYLLDEKSGQQKLPKKLKHQVEEMIVYMMDEILHFRVPDEKLSNLFDKYNGNVDEEDDEDDLFTEEEDLIISANMFANMVHNMTGKKVDPQIFLNDNPTMDQLQEKFQDYLTNLESEKPQKKKTKKQIEREEVEKEKEKIKGQSLRSVYVGLAKILHPDTETDPFLKAEKEEYMKQVTNAYEEKNLSDLLNLELKWLSSHNDSLANTPDETLKYFIMLLKDQVSDLEREHYMASYNPRYQKINEFIGLSEKWSSQKIELKRRRLIKENDLFTELQDDLQNHPKIKEALKKCVEFIKIDEDEYGLDMFDIFMTR